MQWLGYWNDGRTAERRSVHVLLDHDRLVLTDAGSGHAVTVLPLAGLSLAEEVYRGQPLRFRHRERGEARLSVADHGILEPLAARAPALRRRYLGRHGTGRRLVFWGSALVATAVGLIAAVPLLAAPIARSLPLSWEEALGEQIIEGFADDGYCNSAAGVAALSQLTNRIVEGVGASSYRFRVHVFPDEAVNALAAPGGYIVLFDGLIQRAEGPEEVAAVLAHEMAHVIHRHSTTGLVRRTGYSAVLALLFADATGAVALLAGSGELLLNLAHSRDDEAEADRTALRLLNDAGLDSRGLERFFQRLRDDSEAFPAALALLSSHPLHAERAAQAAELGRAGEPPLGDAQWQALKAICREPSAAPAA